MPKNNGKARKKWRQDRLAYLNTLANATERKDLAMYGDRSKVLFEEKPGTEHQYKEKY